MILFFFKQKSAYQMRMSGRSSGVCSCDLLGASYALVRDWTVAFLLPSLLAALGTLWLTFDLGRRLLDRRAGLGAAAAVLCAIQFAYQAKRATIDTTGVFIITLSISCRGRHLLLGPHWRWCGGGVV